MYYCICRAPHAYSTKVLLLVRRKLVLRSTLWDCTRSDDRMRIEGKILANRSMDDMRLPAYRMAACFANVGRSCVATRAVNERTRSEAGGRKDVP